MASAGMPNMGSDMVESTSLAYDDVTNGTFDVNECRHIVPMGVRWVDFAIGLTGIVGNLLVAIVILSSSSLKKKSHNIFILNQSSIDLLVSVLVLAYSCENSHEDSRTTNSALCFLWLSQLPLWALMLISTYNLLALAIVQYLSVIHPICYKVRFTKRLMIGLLVSPWLLGIGYNLAYTLPTTGLIDGYCCTNARWSTEFSRKMFGFITALIQFFIPLTFIIFCYGKIVNRLRHYAKRTCTASASSQPKSKDPILSKAKQNSVVTLVVVSVCFALCWVCNQVVYLAYNLGYPENYTSIWYHTTVLLVNLNCCINPIIYCVKYEQFRQEIRRMLTRSTDTSEEDDQTSCEWNRQRVNAVVATNSTPLQAARRISS